MDEKKRKKEKKILFSSRFDISRELKEGKTRKKKKKKKSRKKGEKIALAATGFQILLCRTSFFGWKKTRGYRLLHNNVTSETFNRKPSWKFWSALMNTLKKTFQNFSEL